MPAFLALICSSTHLLILGEKTRPAFGGLHLTQKALQRKQLRDIFNSLRLEYFRVIYLKSILFRFVCLWNFDALWRKFCRKCKP